ncbi:hypothetical protein TSMEX_000965 [Taenia solium]|eukprot:TsM_001221900 transcript=TsM_001221900 gene=TsM_001221900
MGCQEQLLASTTTGADIATVTNNVSNMSSKASLPSRANTDCLSVLTQREGDLIDSTDPVAAQPFLPLVWATAISMRAEKDGYIRNPHALVNLIQVNRDVASSSMVFDVSASVGRTGS